MKFVIHMEHDLHRAAQAILSLPLQEKDWVVTVRPWSPTRSVEQNARYWWLLTAISMQVKDETGKAYSPETWAEFFKAQFLGKDTIIMDGNPILVSHSSTKLNTIEFGDYMTQIEAWASEHGVTFEDNA